MMVLALCKRRGVPINILWHNTVVESFVPENSSHHVTTQALHIRGDHAYFLADKYAKGWITRREEVEKALQAWPSEALQTVPRPPKTSLVDWKPLPAEIEDMQGEYYTTGDQEMNSARAELHRKGIVPKVV